MSYQTGTATDTADLLDKIRTFLAGQGWTIDDWRYQITQSTKRWLVATKGGFKFQLWEYPSTLGSYSSTPANFGLNWLDAYNSGVDYNAQASPWYYTMANSLAGPFTAYHFFAGDGASGPYFYCALEVVAGQFRHFGFGCLDKYGSYTGGHFVTASAWAVDAPVNSGIPQSLTYGIMPFEDYSNSAYGYVGARATFVRCDSAGGNGINADGAFELTSSRNGAGRARGGSIIGSNALARDAGPITATGVSPIYRVPVAVYRGGGYFSHVGEPPAFRHVRMDYLNPGDEITFGSDVWKVFPVMRLGAPPTGPASGNYGLAYLKA